MRDSEIHSSLSFLPTYSRIDSSDSLVIPVGYKFDNNNNDNNNNNNNNNNNTQLLVDDISSLRFKGDDYQVLKNDQIKYIIIVIL